MIALQIFFKLVTFNSFVPGDQSGIKHEFTPENSFRILHKFYKHLIKRVGGWVLNNLPPSNIFSEIP